MKERKLPPPNPPDEIGPKKTPPPVSDPSPYDPDDPRGAPVKTPDPRPDEHDDPDDPGDPEPTRR